MVPFSLFADPERILRRLYIFAEEPCKSTNTTSEPCSPVFKEAQPRPSEHSKSRISHKQLESVSICIWTVIIYCCNKKHPTDCDKIKGISVLLLETPLTRSKYISPPTHTHTTSNANIGNLLHIRVQTNPSLVENLMSRGRRDKFWIVSSRLSPYSDFSKHS